MKSLRYFVVMLIIEFLFLNCNLQAQTDTVVLGKAPVLYVNDTTFLYPFFDSLIARSQQSILGDLGIPYLICLTFCHQDSMIHVEALQYHDIYLKYLLSDEKFRGGMFYKDKLAIILLGRDSHYESLFHEQKDSIVISHIPKFLIYSHHRKTPITPFLVYKMCDSTYCLFRSEDGNSNLPEAYIKERINHNYSEEKLHLLSHGICNFAIQQKNPLKEERLTIKILRNKNGEYSFINQSFKN